MHIMSQEQHLLNSLHQEYDRLNSIKYDKPIYDAAPVARNTIDNNQVRIINYRGTKLTSFNVDGRQLICLPQAFDFFLKNLVGGLHTVYTKLKRLEIIPIVCNVEQVRVLRSLGAIQPGVNRCKLLAPNEFDILYDDCTSSGSRPGRPPKRNIHPQDDYSEEKRLKFASNHLLRSYPTHLSFLNSTPFTPTLPRLCLSNNTQTPSLHRSTSSNESRSFTIDAMLSNTRDRLTKPIDLSMTNIEQTSSIFPTTTSMNFFHMKNMMDITVGNIRLREKQLENEIVDLKTEITKEQDWKQNLEQDFLQLRRVRSVLIKKLKRLNRSSICSNRSVNLLDQTASNTIPIESN